MREFTPESVSKDILLGISALVIILLALNWINGLQSRTGAFMVLERTGHVRTTTVYDQDTLYYSPITKQMDRIEIKSLHSLSDEYIIVIE